MIFIMGKKVRLPPILPSIPACDLLSQPSGKGWIQEIIEPSPEQDLLDLQLSQRPFSGPVSSSSQALDFGSLYNFKCSYNVLPKPAVEHCFLVVYSFFLVLP